VTVRIETDRLVLRRWRPEDVAPLAEILLDPAVAEWLGDPSWDDVERAIDRYERSWDLLGFGRFAVEERTTGRLVGRVGIMRQDGWVVTPQSDEIGWAIASDCWDRGYATEAARAAIADGFGRVGLPRVLSWTLPGNHASRRVMEKCGLVRQGIAGWAGLEHVWYAIDRRQAPDDSPADAHATASTESARA
jgi:RimJ/RimL family protein N-acetyltransferase